LDTFNGKQNAITLTTTGTSGAATLVGATLNIPQYQAAGTYVTAVTGTSPIVSSGGTTPAISIPAATTSVNGYLTSTDWTTFNGKQNALTNPVTGTGTTNYLPKFTGTSTIGNSIITDNGYYAGFNFAGSGSLGGQNFGVDSVGAFQNNLGSFGYRWLVNNGTNELMRLNASGNLGLGVTPSAWGNNSKPLQMADGSIWGISSLTGYVSVGGNYYYDGSFRYIKTSNATDYYQYDGQHVWRNAPSGTAGNAFSFTQAMTLNASGRLLLGATTDNGTDRLQVSGSGYFSSSVTAGGSVDITGGSLASSNGLHLFFNTSTNTAHISAFNTGVDWRSMNFNALDYVFRTYDGARLTITSTGNVGIGTTSPTATLSVVQSTTPTDFSSPIAIFGGSGADSYAAGAIHSIGLSYIPDYLPQVAIGYTPTSTAGYTLGDLLFATRGVTTNTAPTERMRITSGGNVLIGTTTDNGTDKLQVTGNIKALGSVPEIVAYGAGSSNTVGNSARFNVYDSTNGRGWIIQQNASYDLSFWHDTNFGLSWTNVVKFSATGGITTGTPTGGTARPWKLGSYITTAPSATGYIQVEINGILYKLLAST
jgi:hypothetical protein